MEKKLRILAEREMDRQDAQSLTDYLEDQNNRRVSEMLRTYNDVVSITSPRRMR